MKHSLQGLAALLLLSSVASAQARHEFPLDLIESQPGIEQLVMLPDLDMIQTLTTLDDVLLTGVQLPGGRSVDLQLERISVERRRFNIHVDGAPRTGLIEGLDISVWKGIVVDEPGSTVMLSFSLYGSRGWIRSAGQLVHFMPRADADGSWILGDVLVTTESSLNARGQFAELDCTAFEVPIDPDADSLPSWEPTGGDETLSAGSCSLKEGKVSLETDYQLYQVFGGNLSAETAYCVTLLSFVSDRYENQASTVLTFPYMGFYTNPDDPWTSQDSGGSSVDLLYEFRAAWQGNIPNGGRVGHFMSGASLGGGVAWVDVLCGSSYNFSVSGNINGNVSFPVVVSPNNWDFMVVAHELGHNWGTGHTHGYCPPLDECPSPQYWGSCQTQTLCITDGTIMSYCHLCAGGTLNITTYFHPVVSGVITSRALACLPDYTAFSADSPDILAPGVATPVSAYVGGTPTGGVDLHYRYQGGSFTTIAMVDGGSGTWTASLPAAACSDSPEYYYSYDDTACGMLTSPEGAPGTTYTAIVATVSVVFADDFESATGWSAVNLGASTGDWERGVPVDDSGWDYDPGSDADGSGSCYLTMNQIGNTDVDAGAVQLTSPAFDFSGGPGSISYSYFLRLTNDDGTDRLLVEASSNGAAGPWTEVARHDTDGGLAWRDYTVSAADLASAGVSQTANMMLRFTANDSDPQSIVEAGIDAFQAATLSCGDGSIGNNYCVANANSTGNPALMDASGSASFSSNNLVLSTETVPAGQNGLFYYGPGQMQQAFGNGYRCVGGGQIYRLPVISASAAGVMSFAVDNSQLPHVLNLLPGTTWNFQGWYRDPGVGASFNLSDGYEITFTP